MGLCDFDIAGNEDKRAAAVLLQLLIFYLPFYSHGLALGLVVLGSVWIGLELRVMVKISISGWLSTPLVLGEINLKINCSKLTGNCN